MLLQRANEQGATAWKRFFNTTVQAHMWRLLRRDGVRVYTEVHC
jgi:hypothetical protein